eukprot:1348044-Amorphochlora_amoeboformis.AAC.1
MYALSRECVCQQCLVGLATYTSLLLLAGQRVVFSVDRSAVGHIRKLATQAERKLACVSGRLALVLERNNRIPLSPQNAQIALLDFGIISEKYL